MGKEAKNVVRCGQQTSLLPTNVIHTLKFVDEKEKEDGPEEQPVGATEWKKKYDSLNINVGRMYIGLHDGEHGDKSICTSIVARYMKWKRKNTEVASSRLYVGIGLDAESLRRERGWRVWG